MESSPHRRDQQEGTDFVLSLEMGGNITGCTQKIVMSAKEITFFDFVTKKLEDKKTLSTNIFLMCCMTN